MIMVIIGLCYDRTFWRSSIKKYTNLKNNSDILYVPEHTSYGTIMQNAITFNENLFYYINKWLSELNNNIFCKFSNKQMYKIYQLKYPVFSDLHAYEIKKENQTTCNLYLFNIDYLKNIKSIKIKTKLLKLINYNINLLTNDINALLSLFKYFIENNITTDIKQYINDEYLQHQSYFLENTYQALKILK